MGKPRLAAVATNDAGLPPEFEEAAARVRDYFLTRGDTVVNWYAALSWTCESPIEQKFALSAPVRFAPPFDLGGAIEADLGSLNQMWFDHFVACKVFEDGWAAQLEAQYEWQGYRFDFLVHCACWDGKVYHKLSIFIECDGFDFHERTREQAERDRAKDRLVQTHGHRIFRFTGSEIHRDADACWNEIVAAIDLWATPLIDRRDSTAPAST